jgi:hypothetical protein
MNIENMNSKKIYNPGRLIGAMNSPEQEQNGDFKSFTEELEVTKKELLSENKENLEQNKAASILDAEKNLKNKINEKTNIANHFQRLNQPELPMSLVDKIKKLKSTSLNEKSYKINLKNLNENDVDFLKKLTKHNEINLQLPQFQNQQNLNTNITNAEISYQSTDFSKTFTDMVNQAFKSQKPVRIDFDKEIAVILKIDKQGRVSAEFIPGDKAAEAALRNALPELQAKFNEEKLPYKELKSRNYNDKQERRNNKKESEKDE